MDITEIPDFFLTKEQRAEKRQKEAAIKFKERFAGQDPYPPSDFTS
jgi:hypothetical protein